MVLSNEKLSSCNSLKVFYIFEHLRLYQKSIRTDKINPAIIPQHSYGGAVFLIRKSKMNRRTGSLVKKHKEHSPYVSL